MKINPISFKNRSFNNKQSLANKQYKNNSDFSSNYPLLPSYVAFLGGYSLNLAQTYNNLKDEDYPNLEIKNKIKEVLDDGNIENKTLCDIHFEKYKGILDCFTLEELKEKYPEFENVVAAKDVEAKKESFIGQFQNEQSNIFKSSEDLTLQLIKLYWGQGFSLNDLSKYITSQENNKEKINIHYAMTDKLNIPLMSSRYAGVLKLSNKEYNEKLSQEMSIKIKEANEAKLQKQEGEPVVIPRGLLSEAHKKHISEGLKKYYLENPERIYELSQRQKSFYQNNPRKKEEMSEIMLYAWNNTFEGKKLIKHLTKHMKKCNTSISQEELLLKSELNSKQCLAFKAFWEKNVWAREELSLAMKKAYDYMNLDDSSLINCKTIEGHCMVYQTIPNQVSKKIKSWCRANGLNENDLLTQFTIYIREEDQQKHSNKKTKDLIEKSNKLLDLYNAQYPGIENKYADYYLKTLLKIRNDFYFNNQNLPQSFQNNPVALEAFKIILNKLCTNAKMYIEGENGKIYATNVGITNAESIAIIQKLMLSAMALNCWDFGDYFNKELDNSYRIN